MRVFLLRSLISRGFMIASATTCVMACTLLNALDVVKPDIDASVSTTPDAALSDTSTPAVTETGAPDVVVNAGPPKGAIVVGGAVSGDGGALLPVLTALAPETGLELPQAREKMNVAGAKYDGLRDLWYIFESGGASAFPLPTDPVFLHVRKLDTYTGAWENLQTLKIPPVVSFTHIGVLRERLVYLAYRVELNGDTGTDLVTINTSTPSNVLVIDTKSLDKLPLGLIATRSQSSTPGSVNLLKAVSCEGGGQCLETVHVTVSAEGATIGATTALGRFSGSPAYGSFISSSVDLIAWKTIGAEPFAKLKSFNPLTLQEIGVGIEVGANEPFLKPLATAECLGQALITGTNTELTINSVPLTTTGQSDRLSTGHSGQGVYFEPFTSTALAPFSQGDGFVLTAMKLTGTKDAPKLALRQADWSPPADLRPEIVAIRQPLPIVCP
jgi:hypothetical protein